ncbi:hypothetical protein ACFLW4_00215 [Chloroflexota bacterium]
MPTEMSPQQIQEEITKHVDEFIAALTQPVKVTVKPKKVVEEVLQFDGTDFFGALDNLNRGFLDRGWGDGFPIVPPTRDAVDRMLKGTSRAPDELVVIMEPGKGLGTVEKIAINCVMAGCQPEYLPVVIAAVEAMSEPYFNITVVAQSTGPHCPFIVVNGPIREELGINSGRCALGPGAPSRVNTAIGRAVRLVMMNIGQAYPGVMDMDTIGSPNKYSMCVGENEEANPWGPLHVEAGFDPNTSAVTVFPCESYVEVFDLKSYTPQGVLKTFAHTGNMAGAASSRGWLMVDGPGWNRDTLLVICPDHARIISEAGWTKDDVRRYMFQNCLLPWGVVKNFAEDIRTSLGWQWLYDEPDDRMVPLARDPSYYRIAVVGGDAGKSGYMTSIGSPVTKKISK